MRLSGRSVLLSIGMLCAVLFSTGAGGCRSANPVATANTATPANKPETVALALASTYAVVGEQALAIARDSMTPPAVRQALKDAHLKAIPWVRRLHPAAIQVRDLRKAVAAGTTTPDKLKAALASLNQIVNEAAPQIDRVATLVKGGGS